MLSLGSCSGFLDTKPDTLLTEDQTFEDPTFSLNPYWPIFMDV